MIGQLTIICLALCCGVSVGDEPDCSNCQYFGDTGYVKSDTYCALYYMCTRLGDSYTFTPMCCASGLTFDSEHLTCVNDTEGNCDPSRDLCNVFNGTVFGACPYNATADPAVFQVGENQFQQCAPGTVWSQYNCTCIHDGSDSKPCDKILQFNFDGTFDSSSCNYIVDGTPFNEPSLGGDALCLNGTNFVSVGFLNNWFAWNPIGLTFTVCAWMNPSVANQTGGVFGSNCEWETTQGSVLEFGVLNGYLGVVMGSNQPTVFNEAVPVGQFNQVCVSYDNGDYKVYFNAVNVGSASVPPGMPISSQSDASIGYVASGYFFNGYIDDVCFWTSALSLNDVAANFALGPSNNL